MDKERETLIKLNVLCGIPISAVMLYLSNFIRSGNPNEPPEPEHGGRQEKSRFKNIEWTPYETVHKKYLNLGE